MTPEELKAKVEAMGVWYGITSVMDNDVTIKNRAQKAALARALLVAIARLDWHSPTLAVNRGSMNDIAEALEGTTDEPGR